MNSNFQESVHIWKYAVITLFLSTSTGNRPFRSRGASKRLSSSSKSSGDGISHEYISTTSIKSTSVLAYMMEGTRCSKDAEDFVFETVVLLAIYNSLKLKT